MLATTYTSCCFGSRETLEIHIAMNPGAFPEDTKVAKVLRSTHPEDDSDFWAVFSRDESVISRSFWTPLVDGQVASGVHEFDGDGNLIKSTNLGICTPIEGNDPFVD